MSGCRQPQPSEKKVTLTSVSDDKTLYSTLQGTDDVWTSKGPSADDIGSRDHRLEERRMNRNPDCSKTLRIFSNCCKGRKQKKKNKSNGRRVGLERE